MRPSISLASCLAIAVPLLLAAVPAAGADYHVDRLSDSAVGDCSGDPGDCSLRRAILLANANPGDDVVLLDSGTFELTIAGGNEDAGLTGDLDVTDSVTVVGHGPERTIVDANAIDRVFDVTAPAVTLTLQGLTVTGGSDAATGPQAGGAIRADQGSLSLRTCVVSGNELHGFNVGTAIYSASGGAGDLTEIVDSWITGNSGGGGALTLGRARIERSTVSGNSATVGGAVGLYLSVADSQLLLSTVSGNTGPAGSVGVVTASLRAVIEGCTLSHELGPTLSVTSLASATLRNTLIAGFCTGTGELTSLGGNLESPGGACGLGVDDLDDVLDPGLSALGFFGGPAPVRQLLAGSPALDAVVAVAGCAAVDQRGLSRPRDGDGAGGAVCDIGAVELAGPGELFSDGFECGFSTAWSS